MDNFDSFDIITDIGSGINYDKPGLLKLIEKINKKEVDLIEEFDQYSEGGMI